MICNLRLPRPDLVPQVTAVPTPTQQQPIPDDAANVKTWHFAFNRLPGLPEMLVGARTSPRLAVRRQGAAPRRDRSGGAGGVSPRLRRWRRSCRVQLLPSAVLARRAEAHGRAGRHAPADAGDGDRRERRRRHAADRQHERHRHPPRRQRAPGLRPYLPEECPAAFADAVTDFWAKSPAGRP